MQHQLRRLAAVALVQLGAAAYTDCQHETHIANGS